ncbi:MAG TPA: adenylate/guanylate cyclase domain-containing protein [Spirochaetia bacterium]|nr:adenylate/guanylate cyclase domain-containing protein [Spirochaetia bacterium]
MSPEPTLPRVLIVDDLDDNLKVLSETLQEHGYHPLQAKSGERALQIAAKAVPDLILLDVMMPGMDGYETIRALKADPATADIPVIFISALGQIEDKVKGFQSGAVDYVSKPFQKEEVLARVGTHMKLRQAQRSVEELLHNILPRAVARDLRDNGSSPPQLFPQVTVLFSDLVGFTERSAQLEPQVLIGELNDLFSGFDAIAARHGCERIKTIGDAYLAVCGMPDACPDHAAKVAQAALEMLRFLEERNRTATLRWEMRMGLHSGPVVAGIVGTNKYLYDVFGDTVNTASRMENLSEPMKINLSEATWVLVKDRMKGSVREPVEVKGKGPMRMVFLEG